MLKAGRGGRSSYDDDDDVRVDDDDVRVDDDEAVVEVVVGTCGRPRRA